MINFKKYLPLITNVLVLVGLIFVSYSVSNSQIIIKYDTRENPIASLASHAPIFIDGNSNLEEFCTVGDGSFVTPFIIEKYFINASNADGIFLNNTNAHVIIQNCLIVGGRNINFNGITIQNCSNVQIIACESFHNNNGIIIQWSDNNSFSYNNCSMNIGNGIFLVESNNNEISYNNLSRNWNNGVYFFLDNTNNTILNNNCDMNFDNGIYLNEAVNCIITNNTCISNEVYGVSILGVGNIISTNICKFNIIGIYLNYLQGTLISNNLCSNNKGDGIFLHSWSNNHISNNICVNNGWNGIRIYESDNNIINGNLLGNNYLYGIKIYYSDNNIVNENTFEENLDGTIEMEGDCHNNTFSKNYPAYFTNTQIFAISISVILPILAAMIYYQKKKKKREKSIAES